MIAGLPKENALDVLIKPMLSGYDPIRSDVLNLFMKMYNVTSKKKLVHLQKPKSVLQAGFTKADAINKTVEPYGTETVESKYVEPKHFDVFMQKYREDMEAILEDLANGRGREYHVPNATPAQRTVLNAILNLVTETASDDVYRAIFFGDTAFTAPTGSTFDPQQVKALKQIDGIWKDIKAGVAAGQIPRMDMTATGAPNGSVIPPNYAIDTFLPGLKNGASDELRVHKNGRSIDEAPVFLVDDAMYEAYKADLKARYSSTWPSFKLAITGEAEFSGVNYGLEYDGHAVIPVYEWNIFNRLMGVSKQYRGIFTARRNLTIATDVSTLPSDFGGQGSSLNSLEIYPDANARDRSVGAINIRGTFKLDAKVASYNLISVAY